MLHEECLAAGYVAKKMVGSRVNGDFYRYYTTGSVLAFKTCTMCHTVKQPSEFYSSKTTKDGLTAKCAECTRQRRRAYFESNRERLNEEQRLKGVKNTSRSHEQVLKDRRRLRPDGKKRCFSCGITKETGEYPKAVIQTDGLANSCKRCSRRMRSEYRVSNPDKVNKSYKKYIEKLLSRTDKEIESDRLRARPNGTKRCRECLTNLTFDAFHRDAWSRDGLRSTCSSCTTDHTRRELTEYWVKTGIPIECYLCGGHYDHADHVIPRYLGGPDELHNILPMCVYHNCSKGAIPLDQWLYRKHPHDMERVLRKVIFDYGVNPFAVN